MTPEQITALLGIIGQAPGQALLAYALYTLYRDVRESLKTHLEWHAKQMELYMERDREIITELFPAPHIPVASKWQELPVTNGTPPV